MNSMNGSSAWGAGVLSRAARSICWASASACRTPRARCLRMSPSAQFDWVWSPTCTTQIKRQSADRTGAEVLHLRGLQVARKHVAGGADAFSAGHRRGFRAGVRRRRNRATPDVVVPEVKVAGTGVEREPCPPGNSHIAPVGGAKCGALDAANHKLEAELKEMTSIWPLLSADLREAVLTIARAGRDG